MPTDTTLTLSEADLANAMALATVTGMFTLMRRGDVVTIGEKLEGLLDRTIGEAARRRVVAAHGATIHAHLTSPIGTPA